LTGSFETSHLRNRPLGARAYIGQARYAKVQSLRAVGITREEAHLAFAPEQA